MTLKQRRRTESRGNLDAGSNSELTHHNLLLRIRAAADLYFPGYTRRIARTRARLKSTTGTVLVINKSGLTLSRELELNPKQALTLFRLVLYYSELI